MSHSQFRMNFLKQKDNAIYLCNRYIEIWQIDLNVTPLKMIR